jgi:hypothetical protein
MSIFRPEFEAALRVFGAVSASVDAAGYARPILVGGAAVELYSGSAVATGDFDVVTARQDIFERELQAHGFVRPSGPGVLLRGWIHPELGLGFEVVADNLLGGHADRDRIRLFEVSKTGEFAVISLEDLIADRMGQYHSGTASDMLEQARTLFALYPDADLDYMERRIREETQNDHGIADLASDA